MTEFVRLLNDKWINPSLIRSMDSSDSEPIAVKITWTNGQTEIIRGDYAIALKEFMQIVDKRLDL